MWSDTSWGAGGLIGLLVLIAAVVVLFTGRYPRALYDFVLGMDRWVLRVAAYAGLMTDQYPPFRLDMGGADPGSPQPCPITPPPVAAGAGAGTGTTRAAPDTASPAASTSLTANAAVRGTPARQGWTGGRVVAVVVGSVLLFSAAGAVVASGGLLWADRALRDDGYLTAPAATVSSEGYAVTTEDIELKGVGLDWGIDKIVGDIRVQAAPMDPNTELFIGVGRTADVQSYLGGVAHTEYSSVGAGLLPRFPLVWTQTGRSSDHPGGAPEVLPTQAGIWQETSSGDQALVWRPSAGDWTVAVMRIDGQSGVAAQLQVGAAMPGMGWIAGGILVIGVLALAGGGVLIGVATARARRIPGPGDANTS